MAGTALRWSGLLLVAGGVLLGAAIVVVSSNSTSNQVWSPEVSNLFLISTVLLLISLPGMYVRQANAVGWLGLVGFVLMQAGMVLFAMLATPALWYPSLKMPFPESASAFALGIAASLGLLLTGIATLRAGVFPRWASIVLLVGAALFIFGFFISEFLPPMIGPGVILGAALGVALAWFGVSMMRTTGTPDLPRAQV